jgi:hypothetical protein
MLSFLSVSIILYTILIDSRMVDFNKVSTEIKEAAETLLDQQQNCTFRQM